MSKTNKELVLKKSYDVASVTEMTQMATVLKNHIVKNKLYTTIVGKNYAHVEGWQFAGGMMGIFPKVVAVDNLSTGNEVKWRATVELINVKTNSVIGTGFAICSNKENKKKSFDEYAVLSMAQTRAIGKAYRNLIGWVMKLSGYEGTPSEEMAAVGQRMPEPATYKQPENKEFEKVEVCQNCDAIITAEEATYSKNIFKKKLCRACQNEAKKK